MNKHESDTIDYIVNKVFDANIEKLKNQYPSDRILPELTNTLDSIEYENSGHEICALLIKLEQNMQDLSDDYDPLEYGDVLMDQWYSEDFV